MTTFLDGPAKGITLTLERAPLLLRVVTTPTGLIDALDQHHDSPRTGETVTVYLAASAPLLCFVDGTRPDGKRWGKAIRSCRYAVYSQQPPPEDSADNARWAAWCCRQQEHARQEHAAHLNRPIP